MLFSGVGKSSGIVPPNSSEASKLVCLLGAPRLHREVRLAQCNNVFRGVAILYDEIARIPAQVVGGERPLSATADSDHLMVGNEMVIGLLTAVDAGDPRPLDHSIESLPLGIAQEPRHIARPPKLPALRIDATDGLEW